MIKRSVQRIFTAMWGEFSAEELKKFGFLASIFGLIIAAYWALRPMKDGIFNAIIGLDYQPYAKMLSVLVVFPLVILYGKLIDAFPRHKVFYVLVSLYAVLALIFAYLLMSPEYGLGNTEKSAWRMLGWVWYVYVESFGSLIVALFWAFTTDTTMPESAKRGFPLIALFGQLGNMVGPYFLNAKKFGFSTSAPIVGICGGLMILMGILFWVMMRTVPKSQFESYAGKEESESGEEPGFLEGLKLLVTQPYLMGIFVIITVYEVIVTFLDYHFKMTAAGVYTSEADLSSFLSNYASLTGLVSMICVLAGINNIQRRLGMISSLLLLPALVVVAVIAVKLYPDALMLALWIMVFSKAVNYALNQPTMKQLYIPTSRDTRYKSQAWIEMFGSRGSKAASSSVNTLRAGFKTQYGAAAGVDAFLTLTLLMSLGLVGVWLFAALYIARTYNKAIAEKRVVC